ncbi:hypothetical protein ABIF53_002055 [Bradyrhizobium japonicum]
MVRSCGRCRLCDHAVPGGLVGRSAERRWAACLAKFLGGRDQLLPDACGLQHLLELLRIGRACRHQRTGLRHDLHRPDPGAVVRPDAPVQGHRDREGAERHLRFGLHRRALRQEPGTRGLRDARIAAWRASLYRASAQGRRQELRLSDPPAGAGGRRGAAVLAGLRIRRRRLDGAVRDRVRRPACPRQRASSRADARDRVRERRQADRVPDCRAVRAVRAVRRAGRPADAVSIGSATDGNPELRPDAAGLAFDDHHLGYRLPVPAAGISRGRGRERGAGAYAHRGVALPGLSCAVQPADPADRCGGAHQVRRHDGTPTPTSSRCRSRRTRAPSA